MVVKRLEGNVDLLLISKTKIYCFTLLNILLGDNSSSILTLKSPKTMLRNVKQ